MGIVSIRGLNGFVYDYPTANDSLMQSLGDEFTEADLMTALGNPVLYGNFDKVYNSIGGQVNPDDYYTWQINDVAKLRLKKIFVNSGASVMKPNYVYDYIYTANDGATSSSTVSLTYQAPMSDLRYYYHGPTWVDRKSVV